MAASAGCSSDGSGDSVKKAVQEVEKQANAPFEVTYEVTADRPLESVEYENGGAAQKSVSSPRSPWRATVTLKDMTPPSVMATAAAGDAGAGPVTCRILHQGKVIKEQTAKGETAIATCVAVAPRP
ncbi:hypothetical protein AC230_17725 [Streptomyces caatingaensis]|uniref:Uncharacterized protein n=1 Tax=Streptomyces caatingaensis TaxID=1678637 RepID=A0A0K9XDQ8_9ACTN|nr:hypothetical protein AC230_17725 [Streptomyces caatingaensis]